jgi:hypothetical protein
MRQAACITCGVQVAVTTVTECVGGPATAVFCLQHRPSKSPAEKFLVDMQHELEIQLDRPK